MKLYPCEIHCLPVLYKKPKLEHNISIEITRVLKLGMQKKILINTANKREGS